VEVAVWNAARRLLILVLAALTGLAVTAVCDGRVRPVTATAGGLALAFVCASFVPLLRASRSLRAMQGAIEQPSAARVYRANPSDVDCERAERDAIHHAAVAFVLLALAGSLSVVAAAAR
jgi:hypothetical protein